MSDASAASKRTSRTSPEGYQRKADFAQAQQVSLATVDRMVRRGTAEKTMVGRTPMFRVRQQAADSEQQAAQDAATASRTVLSAPVPNETAMIASEDLINELRALRDEVRQLRQMQQTHQNADAAANGARVEAWWVTWRWRRKGGTGEH